MQGISGNSRKNKEKRSGNEVKIFYMKKLLFFVFIVSLFCLSSEIESKEKYSSTINAPKQKYDKFADLTSICTKPILTSLAYLKLQICIEEEGNILHKPDNFKVIFTSSTNSKKMFEDEENLSLSIINDNELYKYVGVFKNTLDKQVVKDTGKEISNMLVYGAWAGIKDEYKAYYKLTSVVEIPSDVINKIIKSEKTEGKIGELEFKLSKLEKRNIQELVTKSLTFPDKEITNLSPQE